MNKFELQTPRSTRELFVFFTWLALQGFGGIIPFIEHGLVTRKRWMTRDQFLEDWAVARTLPGPPAINMGIIVGTRYFGLKGAAAAILGLLWLPSMIVLLLTITYTLFANQPYIADALRGMGVIAAGMIFATGIKLLSALRTNAMGLMACGTILVGSFIAVVGFEMRIMSVLLTVGVAAWAFAYWKLTKTRAS